MNMYIYNIYVQTCRLADRQTYRVVLWTAFCSQNVWNKLNLTELTKAS